MSYPYTSVKVLQAIQGPEGLGKASPELQAELDRDFDKYVEFLVKQLGFGEEEAVAEANKSFGRNGGL